MVKYGGHVEAVRQADNKGTELYLVPYNHIKAIIFDEKDSAESCQTKFTAAWKEALQQAQTDFTQNVQEKVWQFLFEHLLQQQHPQHDDHDDDDNDNVLEEQQLTPIRGVHPGPALQLLVETSHPRVVQELLTKMTQIHRAAGINSEGLRKLVKKYDKHQPQDPTIYCLSAQLLPLLYTSTVYCGQSMLQDGIAFLRGLLSSQQQQQQEEDELASANGFSGTALSPFMVRHDSETRHQQATEMKLEEWDWLKRLVHSLLEESTSTQEHEAPSPLHDNNNKSSASLVPAQPPPTDSLLSHLVAHRGFHHIKDRNDKRPLENSLSAYELAWTAGIQLCECDIALTQDEHLVLAHDETFLRLALDPRLPNSKRRVSDLTLGELISLPLHSGVRPPLLIDVLRSALAISSSPNITTSTLCQLVIEIKPGNEAAASALARLLLQYPQLRPAVAMIMSFDVVTMHRLRAELTLGSLLQRQQQQQQPQQQKQGEPSSETTAGASVSSGTLNPVASLSQFGLIPHPPRVVSSASLVVDPGTAVAGSHALKRSSAHSQHSASSSRRQSFSSHPTSPFGSSSAIGLSISHHTDLDTIAGIAVEGGLEGPSTSLTPMEGDSLNDSSMATMDGGETHDKTQNQPSTTMVHSDNMPKLMLLTVSDPPAVPCELQVSIQDTSPIDHWLATPQGFGAALDGVYMQFEKHMLTEKGAAHLRDLRARGHLVGIWGYSGKDPDDYESFRWLVHQGKVTFVNSDLPNHFRKDVLVRMAST